MSKPFTKLIVSLLLIVIATVMQVNRLYAGPITDRDKLGDVYMIASVFWAYGMSVSESGYEAPLQFTASLASSQLIVEGLKRTMKQERPDGSDNYSFPSGHSAAAFSGATFVHKRYGWKSALIPYALAGVTAWSRVDLNKHYWRDVIAGAAISGVCTLVIVSNENSGLQLSASPGYIRFKVTF